MVRFWFSHLFFGLGAAVWILSISAVLSLSRGSLFTRISIKKNIFRVGGRLGVFLLFFLFQFSTGNLGVFFDSPGLCFYFLCISFQLSFDTTSICHILLLYHI